MTYRHFQQALLKLGRTSEERAAKLGITPRQLFTWRNKGLPKAIRLVACHPDLLIALIRDTQDSVPDEDNSRPITRAHGDDAVLDK